MTTILNVIEERLERNNSWVDVTKVWAIFLGILCSIAEVTHSPLNYDASSSMVPYEYSKCKGLFRCLGYVDNLLM